YGMVILPMMAGCDADARAIYDSMHAFVASHKDSHGLLAWKQVASGGSCPSDADDSATDGDLDVAFSYLLADKQWGSAGKVDYLTEAKKWIAAFGAHDIVAGTHITSLGDVASENTTRPSDWMLEHFRAFANIDPFFAETVTDTYA